MSATLFEIKKPLETKKRKQRSDKGKPRKVKEPSGVVPVSTVPDPKGEVTPPVSSPTRGAYPTTERGHSWLELAKSVQSPATALPLVGTVVITSYLIFQGFEYLLATNSYMSALTTAIASEVVLLCAAAAHAITRGWVKGVLVLLMGFIVFSGAFYMYSGIKANQVGTTGKYERAVEYRDSIKATLESRRESAARISSASPSKQKEAYAEVADYESKLAAASRDLDELKAPVEGSLYNIIVRVCAMILGLVLTHIAVRSTKQ
jgi:uncharacterized membrane protein (DUF485 family)